MNELLRSLEPWASAWQANLWRASWQGGLAILAAWAIARWWNSLSPRVTCWIWRVVCLKLLVTIVWVEPVAIPILSAATPTMAPSVAGANSIEPRLTDGATTLAIPQQPHVPSDTLGTTPRVEREHPVAVSTILSLLWAACIAAFIAVTIGMWLSVRRLCASAAMTTSDLLAKACRDEANRLECRRLPRIRLSARVESPLLIGVLRPTIVLPQGVVESFDEAELRLMFGHELAHLKRRDLLWNWLPTATGWLFFFHPLVWLLKRCWFEAQEAACDELLIQRQIARPTDYGRLLLKLATCSPKEPRANLAAAGVLGAYRNLERRILAMTSVKSFSRRALIAAAAAVAVIGMLTIVPWRLAAHQAAAAAEPKPEQPLAVKEALAGLAKSLQAMRGYDVYMTVTLEWPYKDVLVDVKDPEHPTRTKTFEQRPWDPGEEPMKAVSISRQILSRDGKQRIEDEEYDSKTGKSARRMSLIVFDGSMMRVLNGTTSGNIRKAKGYCPQGGNGYPIYDGQYLMDHMPLEYLAGERPSTRLVGNQDKGSDLVGILFPAGEGEPSWRDFEFRVWLDRSHGFLPKKVQIYRRQGTEMPLYNQMDVIRFAEPKPGIWAPTEMTYTAFKIEPGPYHGKAVNIYHAAVDVNRSRWCADLDEGLFVLPFPPGVQVWDTRNNLAFTTGAGDDGKDIKQLMAHATKTIHVNQGDSLRREKLDLAKVRQPDRTAATALLKYEAELKANQTGAITSVVVRVDPRSIGLGGANLDDEGLACVGKLLDLEELYLDKTNITDSGLTQLEGLSHLKVLILENTKLTDAGLKHLAPLTNLRRLVVGNNIMHDGQPVRAVRITDEGLGNLKSLTRLESLNLDRTEITDGGLEKLQGMKSLRSLYLFGTQVTDDGVAKFKKALPDCQVARDEPPAPTEQKPATEPNPKSSAPAKEQGADDPREIQRKEAPLLAAMAKEGGYKLDEKQNLRRVAPPFPAIRKEWFRVGNPSLAQQTPAGPTTVVFRWSNDRLTNRETTITYSGQDPLVNGDSLSGLLDVLLEIKKIDVEGPRELLDKPITGDWVVRKGATDEQVVNELSAILRKKLALPVRLEFRTVERPVYVAEGVYRHKPVPGGRDKGTAIRADKTITTDVIEIFGKELVPNVVGGSGGKFQTFLDWLGNWIGTPIVSDVKEPPRDELSWTLHGRFVGKEINAEDRDPALVLANITAQTALSFRKETRRVRILFVSRD
jgi:beta-lactamase regulating signal transducer with metallopeptidase domain